MTFWLGQLAPSALVTTSPVAFPVVEDLVASSNGQENDRPTCHRKPELPLALGQQLLGWRVPERSARLMVSFRIELTHAYAFDFHVGADSA